MPSKNYDLLIDDEVIARDFVLDERRTIEERHQFRRNVIGKVTEHYYKNGVLRLKLTKELHHQDQSETRKIFEYFDARGNAGKKITMELERHGQSHTLFIRAKQAEFVNANGQARSVEHRMTGYCTDSPDSGFREIQVMQRAGTYEDLIGIYIDSFRKWQQSGASSSSKGILLPDSVGADCPEVLFVTIPNEGKYNRCKLDWRKGFRIPVHDGEVSYKVSAVMAIEGSHYLSWRNDAENGRIHFADSMGDVSRDNVTIPVVVTMPDEDTECALQAAHDGVRGKNNHYKDAKDKLNVLGEQVALVIFKRIR